MALSGPTDPTPKLFDAVSIKLRDAYYRTIYLMHTLEPTDKEREELKAEFRLAVEQTLPYTNAEEVDAIMLLVEGFREDAQIRAYFGQFLKLGFGFTVAARASVERVESNHQLEAPLPQIKAKVSRRRSAGLKRRFTKLSKTQPQRHWVVKPNIAP